MNVMNC